MGRLKLGKLKTIKPIKMEVITTGGNRYYQTLLEIVTKDKVYRCFIQGKWDTLDFQRWVGRRITGRISTRWDEGILGAYFEPVKDYYFTGKRKRRARREKSITIIPKRVVWVLGCQPRRKRKRGWTKGLLELITDDKNYRCWVKRRGGLGKWRKKLVGYGVKGKIHKEKKNWCFVLDWLDRGVKRKLLTGFTYNESTPKIRIVSKAT